MKAEGGFNADPLGGNTNFGITQSTYDGFRAKLGLMPLPVKDISQSEVEVIYYTLYWGLGHCDELSTKVSVIHFNTCVNCGVGEAVVLLQKALGVTPTTGFFGPKTLAAAQGAEESTTVTNYISKLKEYYTELKSYGGDYAKDYNGWINRCNALQTWVNSL